MGSGLPWNSGGILLRASVAIVLFQAVSKAAPPRISGDQVTIPSYSHTSLGPNSPQNTHTMEQFENDLLEGSSKHRPVCPMRKDEGTASYPSFYAAQGGGTCCSAERPQIAPHLNCQIAGGGRFVASPFPLAQSTGSYHWTSTREDPGRSWPVASRHHN